MGQEGARKRIVKNTLFLYVRSFLMMGVNIFSSRVILQALGINDYGLYGSIGSIVAMFTIINGVLSVGTSRFITFELGKGDNENLRKTFGASFILHLLLSIVLLLLLETIGLWFLNSKMVIPEGRVFAANVVFQLSVLTCMLSLTQVPYSACIIAHEKMDIYAYIGIVEACFKLFLIYALLYIPFQDNLIAYAIILALWSCGLQVYYRFYCRRNFEECSVIIVKDKVLYKKMLSYSLWDFIGQFCSVGNTQGVNVLINIFFGVTVNAARSVAYQVEGALSQFSNNFLVSVNPQIVKNYAVDDRMSFFTLVTESSRFSYFLLLLVTFPIILEANYILTLWLVEVPEQCVLFLRCVLCISLFRVPMRPVIMGVHATGNVKFLNLTSGLYSVLTFLPFVYFLYKLDFPVWYCFVVQGFNGIVCSYLEALSLKRNMLDFSIAKFFKDVYLKSLFLSIIACLVPCICHLTLNEGLFRFLLTCLSCFIGVVLCILFGGVNSEMRNKILNYLKVYVNKIV